ncbi:MAG: hypothetical protein KC432_12210 [Thermomicrobiales bacterium]|nr:hypothetical protein [Thermomicrobiales bacterium]
MDATRFDHLAQSVAGATRRSLLGALTALPLVGGLLALVGEEEADAHGRRKRRKKRHKYGKGRRRTNRRSKRRFRPEAVAQTCAGTCGSVLNNCRKTVDCGSCACDPTCAACFTARNSRVCREAAWSIPRSRGRHVVRRGRSASPMAPAPVMPAVAAIPLPSVTAASV